MIGEGSIEPIVASATIAKARRSKSGIGTVAGTARLTETLHSQKPLDSIALIYAPAQYVIRNGRWESGQVSVRRAIVARFVIVLMAIFTLGHLFDRAPVAGRGPPKRDLGQRREPYRTSRQGSIRCMKRGSGANEISL